MCSWFCQNYTIRNMLSWETISNYVVRNVLSWEKIPSMVETGGAWGRHRGPSALTGPRLPRPRPCTLLSRKHPDHPFPAPSSNPKPSLPATTDRPSPKSWTIMSQTRYLLIGGGGGDEFSAVKKIHPRYRTESMRRMSPITVLI